MQHGIQAKPHPFSPEGEVMAQHREMITVVIHGETSAGFQLLQGKFAPSGSASVVNGIYL